MSVLIFSNLNPNLTIFHDRLILHMSGNNVNFVSQNCYAVLPGNNLCPEMSSFSKSSHRISKIISYYGFQQFYFSAKFWQTKIKIQNQNKPVVKKVYEWWSCPYTKTIPHRIIIYAKQQPGHSYNFWSTAQSHVL